MWKPISVLVILIAFFVGGYMQNSVSEKKPERNENNQLELEIWTDRGKDALLYSQGETMEFYLRTNQPCYVQLLYSLADGRKTVLVDNLKINLESVNQSLSVNDLLGLDFVCSSPFGTERMIALSRNRPFDKLETFEENGYLFIVNGKLNQLRNTVQGTKGSKQSKQNDQALKQAEAKLMITTVQYAS